MGQARIAAKKPSVRDTPNAGSKAGLRGSAVVRPPRHDHRVLAENLSRGRGYAIDPAKVALALAEMDTDLLYQEAHGSVEWEVWDKASPINGVPAEEVLARAEYAQADVIYLVRVGGDVVFFQPHAPGVSGFQNITDDVVETMAAEHAASIVEDIVANSVLTALDNDPDVVVLPAFMQQPVDPAAVAQAVVEAIDSRPQGAAAGGRPVGRR